MNDNPETLQQVINSEQEVLMNAEEVYDSFFSHAVNLVTLLNNLVASIDVPNKFLFLAFLSQIKKHLTLALFSAVRRHHVQSGMNLRQVLEATAWAAYALANENLDLFRVQNGNGIEVPNRLSKARNRWLNENYPVHSEKIRNLKDSINQSVAHANIAYAFQTFDLPEDLNSGFEMPFFDIEDDFRVKTDLLMVSDFAIGIIDLFITINQTEAVFQSPVDIRNQWVGLVQEHHSLREIIRTHERFININ